MRKDFLSCMMLGKIEPTKYISEDFVINEESAFDFPLSYLIENEVVDGDTIEIITAVEHGEGDARNSIINYALYEKEVRQILQNRNVELHFTEVETNKKFEDKTFTKFFKRIGGLLQEDDEVYADFTFGMKAYSLSMFIAFAYVVKAAETINLRCLLYSQKFTGTDNAENKKTSELCDITSLFYLDAIAGNAKPGQKQALDEVMDMIIKE